LATGIAMNSEDLKSIAKSYGELRRRMMADLRKMDEHSEALFKAFLQYIKSTEIKNMEFSVLLDVFLSEELNLDRNEERATRLSLIRRFYSLARRHIRDSEKQRSLIPYLQD
jgi:hypothetical protein